MGVFDRFKKKDSLNSEPSLYLIPLSHDKTPVLCRLAKGDSSMLVALAVALDGKVVTLPVDDAAVHSIVERISEEYPNDMGKGGNPVTHWLAAGVVMGGDSKLGSVKLAFSVCGFNERHGGGIDMLYEALDSISKTQFGSIEYMQIEKFLSSDSMKEWIRQSIAFLKRQLRWSEYVQSALDSARREL